MSHSSACDALRTRGEHASDLPRWPSEPRKLPRYGDCVSTQRAFNKYARETDLQAYGMGNDPVHLLVPSASSRSRGKNAIFHVWSRELPARSLYRLSDTLFASTPEFVLLQMAAQKCNPERLIDDFAKKSQAERELLKRIGSNEDPVYDDPFAWERKSRLVSMALVATEFAGYYRLPTVLRDTQYQLKPLVTLENQHAFLGTHPNLYGASRVREALGLAFDRSASPMESALALMLSLPVEAGGFGLPKPELNKKVPTEQFESMWDGGPVITPDLLWEECKVAVEYESDEFHGRLGAGKADVDAVRANVLTAMGYAVFRATKGTARSISATGCLAQQVAQAMGITVIDPSEVEAIRRQKLHVLLMGS